MFLMASDEVTMRVKDSGGTYLLGNASHGLLIPAGGGFVLPFTEREWFRGSIGKNIILNLSSGVAVAGVIGYELFPLVLSAT